MIFDARPRKGDKFLGKDVWKANTYPAANAIDSSNFSLGPVASYTTDYSVTVYKRF